MEWPECTHGLYVTKALTLKNSVNRSQYFTPPRSWKNFELTQELWVWLYYLNDDLGHLLRYLIDSWPRFSLSFLALNLYFNDINLLIVVPRANFSMIFNLLQCQECHNVHFAILWANPRVSLRNAVNDLTLKDRRNQILFDWFVL